MQDLAILYRLKQFLGHQCHQMVSRIVFLQDHEFLGEIYGRAEDHYDDVIERMIGLGKTPDLPMIQVQAAQKLTQIPLTYKENSECFNAILSLNKQILALIETMAKTPGMLSQGTLNMLADEADQIEREQYRIGQRVKK